MPVQGPNDHGFSYTPSSGDGVSASMVIGLFVAALAVFAAVIFVL